MSFHPQYFRTPVARRTVLLSVALASLASFGCASSTPSATETAPEAATATTEAVATETTEAAAESGLTVDVFSASEAGLLVNSTLIMGENEAILVDAQYGRSDAEALVSWLQASGKTLTAIWITHAHPDHYFGTTVLKESFPDVPVYTSPEVAAKVAQLNDMFVQNVPKLMPPEEALTEPVVPTAYAEATLELEGETIDILSLDQGDTSMMTALYIPSSGTLVAGDLVYDQVHIFMNENTTPELRQKWLTSLDTLAALNPTQIIPGHQSPDLKGGDGLTAIDFTRSYLEAFDAATALPTSEEAAKALVEAFPEAKLPFLANMGVKAAYGEGGL